MLLAQAVDGVGMPPAGSRQGLVAGVLAIGGNRIIELEAGAHDRALRIVDGVFGLVDAVAAGGGGLGVALALAHRGLGFGRRKAGARLLVLEPDQHFALGHPVVHGDRDLLHASGQAGADANLAGTRLDTPGRGGNPGQLRAGDLRRRRRRGCRRRWRVELHLDGVARRHDEGNGKACKAERGKTGEDGKLPGHTAAAPLVSHMLVGCHRRAASHLHGSDPHFMGLGSAAQGMRGSIRSHLGASRPARCFA